MGDYTFSREAYSRATEDHIPKSGPTTARAEQKAKETGKLNPLVDPAGYGVVRRSLIRFELDEKTGLYRVTKGCSVPVETRTDTTGSMGHNVDVIHEVLPEFYEMTLPLVPDCDLHFLPAIFGDVVDRFVLCRPQFEMIAEKIVQQIALMVPCRGGGDTTEDPHYGIFGAAYLVAAYINRIGLKGYDFTASDADSRTRFDESQLTRIYGDTVFEKAKANGHPIDKDDLPDLKEVVQDLLKRAHAFFLQVGSNRSVTSFWSRIYGKERVIELPDTRYLPHVQATIIGLTEGTLGLTDVVDFLRQNNMEKEVAEVILRSVSKIPIGAQAALPNFKKRPKPGDYFKTKTDLWPIDPKDLPDEIKEKKDKKQPKAGGKDGKKPDAAEAGPEWI